MATKSLPQTSRADTWLSLCFLLLTLPLSSAELDSICQRNSVSISTLVWSCISVFIGTILLEVILYLGYKHFFKKHKTEVMTQTEAWVSPTEPPESDKGDEVCKCERKDWLKRRKGECCEIMDDNESVSSESIRSETDRDSIPSLYDGSDEETNNNTNPIIKVANSFTHCLSKSLVCRTNLIKTPDVTTNLESILPNTKNPSVLPEVDKFHLSSDWLNLNFPLFGIPRQELIVGVVSGGENPDSDEGPSVHIEPPRVRQVRSSNSKSRHQQEQKGTQKNQMKPKHHSCSESSVIEIEPDQPSAPHGQLLDFDEEFSVADSNLTESSDEDLYDYGDEERLTRRKAMHLRYTDPGFVGHGNFRASMGNLSLDIPRLARDMDNLIEVDEALEEAMQAHGASRARRKPTVDPNIQLRAHDPHGTGFIRVLPSVPYARKPRRRYAMSYDVTPMSDSQDSQDYSQDSSDTSDGEDTVRRKMREDQRYVVLDDGQIVRQVSFRDPLESIVSEREVLGYAMDDTDLVRQRRSRRRNGQQSHLRQRRSRSESPRRRNGRQLVPVLDVPPMGFRDEDEFLVEEALFTKSSARKLFTDRNTGTYPSRCGHEIPVRTRKERSIDKKQEKKKLITVKATQWDGPETIETSTEPRVSWDRLLTQMEDAITVEVVTAQENQRALYASSSRSPHSSPESMSIENRGRLREPSRYKSRTTHTRSFTTSPQRTSQVVYPSRSRSQSPIRPNRRPILIKETGTDPVVPFPELIKSVRFARETSSIEDMSNSRDVSRGISSVESETEERLEARQTRHPTPQRVPILGRFSIKSQRKPRTSEAFTSPELSWQDVIEIAVEQAEARLKSKSKKPRKSPISGEGSKHLGVFSLRAIEDETPETVERGTSPITQGLQTLLEETTSSLKKQRSKPSSAKPKERSHLGTFTLKKQQDEPALTNVGTGPELTWNDMVSEIEIAAIERYRREQMPKDRAPPVVGVFKLKKDKVKKVEKVDSSTEPLVDWRDMVEEIEDNAKETYRRSMIPTESSKPLLGIIKLKKEEEKRVEKSPVTPLVGIFKLQKDKQEEKPRTDAATDPIDLEEDILEHANPKPVKHLGHFTLKQDVPKLVEEATEPETSWSELLQDIRDEFENEYRKTIRQLQAQLAMLEDRPTPVGVIKLMSTPKEIPDVSHKGTEPEISWTSLMQQIAEETEESVEKQIRSKKEPSATNLGVFKIKLEEHEEKDMDDEKCEYKQLEVRDVGLQVLPKKNDSSISFVKKTLDTSSENVKKDLSTGLQVKPETTHTEVNATFDITNEVTDVIFTHTLPAIQVVSQKITVDQGVASIPKNTHATVQMNPHLTEESVGCQIYVKQKHSSQEVSYETAGVATTPTVETMAVQSKPIVVEKSMDYVKETAALGVGCTFVDSQVEEVVNIQFARKNTLSEEKMTSTEVDLKSVCLGTKPLAQDANTQNHIMSSDMLVAHVKETCDTFVENGKLNTSTGYQSDLAYVNEAVCSDVQCHEKATDKHVTYDTMWIEARPIVQLTDMQYRPSTSSKSVSIVASTEDTGVDVVPDDRSTTFKGLQVNQILLENNIGSEIAYSENVLQTHSAAEDKGLTHVKETAEVSVENEYVAVVTGAHVKPISSELAFGSSVASDEKNTEMTFKYNSVGTQVKSDVHSVSLDQKSTVNDSSIGNTRETVTSFTDHARATSLSGVQVKPLSSEFEFDSNVTFDKKMTEMSLLHGTIGTEVRPATKSTSVDQKLSVRDSVVENTRETVDIVTDNARSTSDASAQVKPIYSLSALLSSVTSEEKRTEVSVQYGTAGTEGRTAVNSVSVDQKPAVSESATVITKETADLLTGNTKQTIHVDAQAKPNVFDVGFGSSVTLDDKLTEIASHYKTAETESTLPLKSVCVSQKPTVIDSSEQNTREAVDLNTDNARPVSFAGTQVKTLSSDATLGSNVSFEDKHTEITSNCENVGTNAIPDLQSSGVNVKSVVTTADTSNSRETADSCFYNSREEITYGVQVGATLTDECVGLEKKLQVGRTDMGIGYDTFLAEVRPSLSSVALQTQSDMTDACMAASPSTLIVDLQNAPVWAEASTSNLHDNIQIGIGKTAEEMSFGVQVNAELVDEVVSKCVNYEDRMTNTSLECTTESLEAKPSIDSVCIENQPFGTTKSVCAKLAVNDVQMETLNSQIEDRGSDAIDIGKVRLTKGSQVAVNKYDASTMTENQNDFDVVMDTEIIETELQESNSTEIPEITETWTYLDLTHQEQKEIEMTSEEFLFETHEQEVELREQQVSLLAIQVDRLTSIQGTFKELSNTTVESQVRTASAEEIISVKPTMLSGAIQVKSTSQELASFTEKSAVERDTVVKPTSVEQTTETCWSDNHSEADSGVDMDMQTDETVVMTPAEYEAMTIEMRNLRERVDSLEELLHIHGKSTDVGTVTSIGSVSSSCQAKVSSSFAHIQQDTPGDSSATQTDKVPYQNTGTETQEEYKLVMPAVSSGFGTRPIAVSQVLVETDHECCTPSSTQTSSLESVEQQIQWIPKRDALHTQTKRSLPHDKGTESNRPSQTDVQLQGLGTHSVLRGDQTDVIDMKNLGIVVTPTNKKSESQTEDLVQPTIVEQVLERSAVRMPTVCQFGLQTETRKETAQTFTSSQYSTMHSQTMHPINNIITQTLGDVSVSSTNYSSSRADFQLQAASSPVQENRDCQTIALTAISKETQYHVDGVNKDVQTVQNVRDFATIYENFQEHLETQTMQRDVMSHGQQLNMSETDTKTSQTLIADDVEMSVIAIPSVEVSLQVDEIKTLMQSQVQHEALFDVSSSQTLERDVRHAGYQIQEVKLDIANTPSQCKPVAVDFHSQTSRCIIEDQTQTSQLAAKQRESQFTEAKPVSHDSSFQYLTPVNISHTQSVQQTEDSSAQTDARALSDTPTQYTSSATIGATQTLDKMEQPSILVESLITKDVEYHFMETPALQKLMDSPAPQKLMGDSSIQTERTATRDASSQHKSNVKLGYTQYSHHREDTAQQTDGLSSLDSSSQYISNLNYGNSQTSCQSEELSVQVESLVSRKSMSKVLEAKPSFSETSSQSSTSIIAAHIQTKLKVDELAMQVDSFKSVTTLGVETKPTVSESLIQRATKSSFDNSQTLNDTKIVSMQVDSLPPSQTLPKILEAKPTASENSVQSRSLMETAHSQTKPRTDEFSMQVDSLKSVAARVVEAKPKVLESSLQRLTSYNYGDSQTSHTSEDLSVQVDSHLETIVPQETVSQMVSARPVLQDSTSQSCPAVGFHNTQTAHAVVVSSEFQTDSIKPTSNQSVEAKPLVLDTTSQYKSKIDFGTTQTGPQVVQETSLQAHIPTYQASQMIEIRPSVLDSASQSMFARKVGHTQTLPIAPDAMIAVEEMVFKTTENVLEGSPKAVHHAACLANPSANSINTQTTLKVDEAVMQIESSKERTSFTVEAKPGVSNMSLQSSVPALQGNSQTTPNIKEMSTQLESAILKRVDSHLVEVRPIVLDSLNQCFPVMNVVGSQTAHEVQEASLQTENKRSDTYLQYTSSTNLGNTQVAPFVKESSIQVEVLSNPLASREADAKPALQDSSSQYQPSVSHGVTQTSEKSASSLQFLFTLKDENTQTRVMTGESSLQTEMSQSVNSSQQFVSLNGSTNTQTSKNHGVLSVQTEKTFLPETSSQTLFSTVTESIETLPVPVESPLEIESLITKEVALKLMDSPARNKFDVSTTQTEGSVLSNSSSQYEPSLCSEKTQTLLENKDTAVQVGRKEILQEDSSQHEVKTNFTSTQTVGVNRSNVGQMFHREKTLSDKTSQYERQDSYFESQTGRVSTHELATQNSEKNMQTPEKNVRFMIPSAEGSTQTTESLKLPVKHKTQQTDNSSVAEKASQIEEEKASLSDRMIQSEMSKDSYAFQTSFITTDIKPLMTERIGQTDQGIEPIKQLYKDTTSQVDIRFENKPFFSRPSLDFNSFQTPDMKPNRIATQSDVATTDSASEILCPIKEIVEQRSTMTSPPPGKVLACASLQTHPATADATTHTEEHQDDSNSGSEITEIWELKADGAPLSTIEKEIREMLRMKKVLTSNMVNEEHQENEFKLSPTVVTGTLAKPEVVDSHTSVSLHSHHTKSIDVQPVVKHTHVTTGPNQTLSSVQVQPFAITKSSQSHSEIEDRSIPPIVQPCCISSLQVNTVRSHTTELQIQVGEPSIRRKETPSLREVTVREMATGSTGDVIAKWSAEDNKSRSNVKVHASPTTLEKGTQYISYERPNPHTHQSDGTLTEMADRLAVATQTIRTQIANAGLSHREDHVYRDNHSHRDRLERVQGTPIQGSTLSSSVRSRKSMTERQELSSLVERKLRQFVDPELLKMVPFETLEFVEEEIISELRIMLLERQRQEVEQELRPKLMDELKREIQREKAQTKGTRTSPSRAVQLDRSHRHEETFPHSSTDLDDGLSYWVRKRLEEEVKRELQLSLRKEVRSELAKELYSDVRRELRGMLQEEVSAEIAAEVRDTVTAQVAVEVEKELRNTIGKQIRNDIERNLRPAIERQLTDELREEMRMEIAKEVRDEVKEAVIIEFDAREDIRQQVAKEIEPQVWEEVSHDLREEVRQNLRLELYEDVKKEIQRDITTRMHPEITSKLELKVRNELRDLLRDEMKGDVIFELRSDLEESVRNKLHIELEDTVRQEIEEDIRNVIYQQEENSYRTGIEEQLRTVLEPKLRQEIDKEVRGSIEAEMREKGWVLNSAEPMLMLSKGTSVANDPLKDEVVQTSFYVFEQGVQVDKNQSLTRNSLTQSGLKTRPKSTMTYDSRVREINVQIMPVTKECGINVSDEPSTKDSMVQTDLNPGKDQSNQFTSVVPVVDEATQYKFAVGKSSIPVQTQVETRSQGVRQNINFSSITMQTTPESTETGTDTVRRHQVTDMTSQRKFSRFCYEPLGVRSSSPGYQASHLGSDVDFADEEPVKIPRASNDEFSETDHTDNETDNFLHTSTKEINITPSSIEQSHSWKISETLSKSKLLLPVSTSSPLSETEASRYDSKEGDRPESSETSDISWTFISSSDPSLHIEGSGYTREQKQPNIVADSPPERDSASFLFLETEEGVGSTSRRQPNVDRGQVLGRDQSEQPRTMARRADQYIRDSTASDRFESSTIVHANPPATSDRHLGMQRVYFAEETSQSPQFHYSSPEGQEVSDSHIAPRDRHLQSSLMPREVRQLNTQPVQKQKLNQQQQWQLQREQQLQVQKQLEDKRQQQLEQRKLQREQLQKQQMERLQRQSQSQIYSHLLQKQKLHHQLKELQGRVKESSERSVEQTLPSDQTSAKVTSQPPSPEQQQRRPGHVDVEQHIKRETKSYTHKDDKRETS